MDALANTPAPDQNLAEFLLEQWVFVEAPEPVKDAGEAIINALDADGYLRQTLEELVTAEPPVTPESLRAALPLVQRLEPPGVGARDLGECLLIQLTALEASGIDVALPRLLVGEYLREIERNHIPLIARKTGKTVTEINEALAGLARLDPRPGRSIGSARGRHGCGRRFRGPNGAGDVVGATRGIVRQEDREHSGGPGDGGDARGHEPVLDRGAERAGDRKEKQAGDRGEEDDAGEVFHGSGRSRLREMSGFNSQREIRPKKGSSKLAGCRRCVLPCPSARPNHAGPAQFPGKATPGRRSSHAWPWRPRSPALRPPPQW